MRAAVQHLNLSYADLPNAYRLNLSAEFGDQKYVATIETTFSDLFNIFGAPRRDETFCPNEWVFVDAKGRTFLVADGVIPSETINGPYEFEIYAPSFLEGHDFARWLSDRVYAHSLTREYKFIA